MDPTDSLPQRSTFHFLLLVLLPVLVMTIAETTAISHFLSAYTAAAVGFKTLLLALAGFSLLIAWWLMSVNRPNRSFRVGVALLASFLIVLSMAGYIVFTKVPVSAIRSSRLLSALFFDVPGWWRYWNAFGDVALIGSFFAFGRTRIALVSSATIICTLWGATQHIWR